MRADCAFRPALLIEVFRLFGEPHLVGSVGAAYRGRPGGKGSDHVSGVTAVVVAAHKWNGDIIRWSMWSGLVGSGHRLSSGRASSARP
jgi:hypothetical protein